MARPQRENGHVDIANDIVGALARTQLSGYESRVLWGLLRETWGQVIIGENRKIVRDSKGWPLKKKKARISSKKWEELTGLNKYNISRTLRGLQLRQIVIKNDNNNEWGFQKDYDKWLLPIKEIVIKNDNIYFVIRNDNAFVEIDNKIIEIDNKKFPKAPPKKKQRASKETLKETLKERRTKMLSQIKKLESQFPQKIQEFVEEYVELARMENESKGITLQKHKRLINELYLLYLSCEQEGIEDILRNDFETALIKAVEREAPHINYVKKVMKSLAQKRKVQLKLGATK